MNQRNCYSMSPGEYPEDEFRWHMAVGTVLFLILNNLGCLAQKNVDSHPEGFPFPGAGLSSCQVILSPSLVVHYTKPKIQGKMINLSNNLIRLLPSNWIKISVGSYDIAARIHKSYLSLPSFGGDFYIELSKLNFIR